MLNLPPTMIDLVEPFAPCFCGATTWRKAQVLLVGAILTPGKRAVTTALRVMGLGQSRQYAQYHQVLNRAVWSPLALAQVLLKLLVSTFVGADQPLVLGLDTTIERRWGRKIAARGIYHDPVRSSKKHFVKTSGLRWLCLMALCPIAWAQRVWALPVMTVLAPSSRYYQQQGRVARTFLERGVQMMKVLRRWLPHRMLVLVGDSAFAAFAFLSQMQQMGITCVTRLRWDAGLYAPPPIYTGRGRPRKVGDRLPSLKTVLEDPTTRWERLTVPWYDGQWRTMDIASGTAIWYHKGKPPIPHRWVIIRDPQHEYESVALLCTDPQACPAQVTTWFVQRWRLEVTFQEARRHLSFGSQRHWSSTAIARTTPVLLGLFSWVTLLAHALYTTDPHQCLPQTAWYAKVLPTFADALALVRQQLWSAYPFFGTSPPQPDMLKIPSPLFDTLISSLCYAA